MHLAKVVDNIGVGRRKTLRLFVFLLLCNTKQNTIAAHHRGGLTFLDFVFVFLYKTKCFRVCVFVYMFPIHAAEHFCHTRWG